ncbi:MAG: 4Fe-4S binding protein [Muribaculaceae bacterium]|nr:4Fe-4S binding protein [Muribaculaceae bacterium]
MNEQNLKAIFFSATDTTRRCVEMIAQAMDMPLTVSVNLADRNVKLPELNDNDIVIVAAPVYGGRIPTLAADKLKYLNGNGAKVIAMVVYGNRDYDDALLELTDILTETGCKICAAAAFIGQHSIFPKVGTSRPDKADLEKLAEFGRQCKATLVSDIAKTDLSIKGNRPYKKYGGVPVHPVGSRKDCHKCGVCAEKCPVEAISIEAPWETDAQKCISCGRCIFVCSSGSRGYNGIKYNLIGKVFVAGFSHRKEPEIFI